MHAWRQRCLKAALVVASLLVIVFLAVVFFL
jgi:hypothetical protein